MNIESMIAAFTPLMSPGYSNMADRRTASSGVESILFQTLLHDVHMVGNGSSNDASASLINDMFSQVLASDIVNSHQYTFGQFSLRTSVANTGGVL